MSADELNDKQKNLDLKISELEKFIINECNYDLPQEVLEDLINID